MDKLAPIPELLPCPCCGGKAHLTKREGFGPAGGKYSRGYVSCRKCSLTTPTKSPWKAAVERWNRRSAAVTPETVDAACCAMAITIARQDGLTLTKAGYEHGKRERPEAHAQMVEYVTDGLQAAAAVTPEIPDGWALVPIEPTAEMIKAGESWSGLPSATWADMIDAAPLPAAPSLSGAPEDNDA